ncbi:MAG TPA: hypothetical protein VFN54_04870 [Acidimicrobiales bacterium]|nr:hypothetical protein [Acidimicrobiales bacterium]
MNTKIAKIILPAVLSVGTLGAAALTATAGATTTTTATHAKTKTTHPTATKSAVVTLRGAVVKTEASKDIFWFKDGAKTYRVDFKAAKFTKGHAASITKGAIVTVTGHYVGKSTSVILATSVSA